MLNSFLSLGAALGALHITLALFGAYHALTFKRDPRSALGWIFVCLALPFAGPLIYYLFGINRVRTRARKLGRDTVIFGQERPQSPVRPVPTVLAIDQKFSHLQTISDRVSERPLVTGNSVEPLYDGDTAYVAMLAAIDAAATRVVLATYLFDTDPTGRRFIDALAAAARRGVDVAVLVDGIGELYAWPRATRLLRSRGVRTARFLPPRLLPPAVRLNLRNHRKLLVVDDAVAFTGGMNIGGRHVRDERGVRAVDDLHFRLHGPVVAELAAVFWEDWQFTTGEQRPPPVAVPGDAGTLPCRVVTDGPGEDLDKLSLILHAVIATARHSVWIMTPYFLPTRELITALQIAALRGAQVNVLLPERSNLVFVDWASRNTLWQLMQWGINIHYQPAPFVHSKLLVVDESYVQIGSANLDARSLRLNFEVAVEIIDTGFAARMIEHCRAAAARSRPVSLAELDARSLPVRIRDALAWLASPYL